MSKQSEPDEPAEVAVANSLSVPHADKTRLTAVSRDQVERSYRRYAPVYDLLFGASLGPGRSAMLRAVQQLAPQSILEVGVGTGLALPRYPAASRIVGVDVSPQMLEVARRRVRADADRIRLEVMDAEAMSFADASFDCVTLPYVLSVTPNPERLVAEVRRVCRPGGHILIVNHFSGHMPWRPVERLLRPLAGPLGFRTEFSLQQHVLRHDWEVLSIETTNLLALSRLILIRNV